MEREVSFYPVADEYLQHRMGERLYKVVIKS